uniref:Coiled-coil domain containing 57 n=1 Tax=Cyclopterus lumpus TaxID=8103 RepID=A0A8C3A2G5_CYCLU
MQSDRDSGLGELEAQLASKEREWKELLAARDHQLETSLNKAQQESFFLRYLEDFQFNLAIVDERDRELETYDVLMARALTTGHDRYSSSRPLPSKSREGLGHVERLDCSAMTGEIQKQTETYERMKWDLQCRIQELERKLTLQRQEMTAASDREVREQEHKFNLRMDEMRSVVLSCELKVKLLSKENEVHLQARHQSTDALTASQEVSQQIQTQLQHQEQEIKDLTVEATQTGWDKYISQVSSEMVVKDTKIIALHERETKYLTERERSRKETERYKEHLSAGLKRERALDQMQVQVKVDWQRRCEDMKAQHYLANEQLIQDLTQARDQAKAELKEKEQDLQDLTVLLCSVKSERDQAVQGLTPKVDSLASEEIYCLQQQNSVLRAVVTQMRKDMEGLIHLLPPPQAHPQASSPQPVQHPGTPAATPIPPTATTQMATGPLDQSTNISLKVSFRFNYLNCNFAFIRLCPLVCGMLPSGGQCSEKRANTSALAEQDDRHTEWARANLMEQVLKEVSKLVEVVMSRWLLGSVVLKRVKPTVLSHNPVPSSSILSSFQSALLRQLQEENLYLRQQQASGLMAGGLLENMQGGRRDPPLLRSRLKWAAFCIARLSREKQQLIEMGNRLRAQTTAARPQSTVSDTHTHGSLLGLFVCLFVCTVPQLTSTTNKHIFSYCKHTLPASIHLYLYPNVIATRLKSIGYLLSPCLLKNKNMIDDVRPEIDSEDGGARQTFWLRGHNDIQFDRRAGPVSDGWRVLV